MAEPAPKLSLSHERALRRLTRLLGARPHLLAVCVASRSAVREAIERELGARVAPRRVRRATLGDEGTSPWPSGGGDDHGARTVWSVALPLDSPASSLARLNLAREAIPREALSVLLWVEGFEGLDALREHAPDLWATRSGVMFFLSFGGVEPEAKRAAVAVVRHDERAGAALPALDAELRALDAQVARGLLPPSALMAAQVRRAQLLVAEGRYVEAQRDVEAASGHFGSADLTPELWRAATDGVSLLFWLWSRQGDLDRVLSEGARLARSAATPGSLGTGAAGLMEYVRTLRHRERALEALATLDVFDQTASAAAVRDDANRRDVINARLERVLALRSLGARGEAHGLASRFASDFAWLGTLQSHHGRTLAAQISRALLALHRDAAEPRLATREGIVTLLIGVRTGHYTVAHLAAADVVALCVETGDLEDAFSFSYELLRRASVRMRRDGGNDWWPRMARLAVRHGRDVRPILSALERVDANAEADVLPARAERIHLRARVRVALGGGHARGARTEAVRDLRALIPEADRGGVDHGFAVREALAELSQDMARFDDAERYLRWLFDRARRGWGRPAQARLLSTLAQVARRRGRSADALRLVDEARAACESDPEPLRSRFELKRWRMTRALIWEALGDLAAARADLAVARDALAQEGLRRELFDVLFALAALRPAAGADDHRMEAARAALDMARDAELVGEEARALVAVAALHAEAGDRAAAAPLAREAAWIAEELADDEAARRAKGLLCAP